MPEQSDDKELRERDEGLIRRAWRHRRRPPGVVDQLTGLVRAPVAAFEPRPTDKALSINIERSVRSAGLDPATFNVDPVKQYAARVTVGDCHDNGLTAFRDPVDGNPHHGLIYGLVEIRDTNPDGYERALNALAKASRVITTGTP